MAENNLVAAPPNPLPEASHGAQDGFYGTGITRQRAIFTFAIVSLALVMAGIDSTIVAVSLPSIMTDLRTNLAFLGWVITGYQFSSCIIMPVVGKISDDWGRKRVFMLAVALFTLSSLAAGFAPNIFWLIIFRILQGLGGGAFLPSATGIISDAFGKHRSTAIGLFASIFPIGGVIGPNVGGFIVDHLSWRWVFYVNIPIGLLLLLLGILVLPKSTSLASRHSTDFLGAGLFSGAILAILYALTNWSNNPQDPGILTWVLFAVGVFLLVLFVNQENKITEPMIELKLLRWRPLAAANLYNFIFGAAVFGIYAFIPYYATIAYGMTGSESGLILTPRSISVIVVAALTSIFIIRYSYRLPMILGAVVMSVGFFLLSMGFHDVTILGWHIQNLVVLALIVMIGGIGMGIANPTANNAILDLVPEKIAAVTGMRGMFRVIGGVFGTAVVVLLLSHFQDKVQGMQRISLIYGFLILLAVPLTFLIPDSANKRWRNRKNPINSPKLSK